MRCIYFTRSIEENGTKYKETETIKSCWRGFIIIITNRYTIHFNQMRLISQHHIYKITNSAYVNELLRQEYTRINVVSKEDSLFRNTAKHQI
jgi:hypothetical protein